jgi:hypothetical protein
MSGEIGNGPRANLAMWTVYNNPTDYPGKFVARQFDIRYGAPRPTQSIIIMDDLDKLREVLAFELHLVCLSRSPEDESQIVETWL